jgi:DNA-binding transcriptional ArsR family regulator
MKDLEDPDGLSEINEPAKGPESTEQGNRVLILPVNGESRKITQILSNETSMKILELLGEKSMSATNVAEKLNLPLTTVKYNIDSLVESDLVKVQQIKWSQKGRQIKIYEPVEKLIVLVPSKSSIDRLSIINILKKYMGVIVAAFFAAAGIEYFSAYMQAKRIFDATYPLSTGDNVSKNVSPTIATDHEVPENEALKTSPKTMEAGTGNVSSGMENGQGPEATGGHAPVSVHTPTHTGADSAHNLTPIPPENLAHVGGGHGLYDAISLHPGVWFLFGCIFIVVLMIVKEVYYKKRASNRR